MRFLPLVLVVPAISVRPPTIGVEVEASPGCISTAHAKVCAASGDNAKADHFEVRPSGSMCALSVSLKTLHGDSVSNAFAVAVIRVLENSPASVLSSVDCDPNAQPKDSFEGSRYQSTSKGTEYTCKLSNRKIGSLKLDNRVGVVDVKKINKVCGYVKSQGWRLIRALRGKSLATIDSTVMKLVRPSEEKLAKKCQIALPKDSPDRPMSQCLELSGESNSELAYSVYADGDFLAVVCVDTTRMEWLGTYRVTRKYIAEDTTKTFRISSKTASRHQVDSAEQIGDSDKGPIAVAKTAGPKVCTALKNWLDGN